ncbi:TPA: DUF1846 family protein [Candidatus Woesearchaeota archaeon]|nr:DUF1846 family protein [Candidatus Woesearchaeota archaeon]
MHKKGFSTEKYLAAQTKAILERVSRFDKLYLEFGGKLLTDMHAARVLPGYEFDAKTKVLQSLKEEAEFFYCVCAKDLQKGRVRHDFGLSYDALTIKEVNDMEELGLEVTAIVISRFDGEAAAERFRNKLLNMGKKVYMTPEVKGYLENMDRLVGEEGFGRYPRISSKKRIVVVTGAGGGSGKMSTCLSQLYHDAKNKVKSGYAKFETFPIWNLPLKHPVNVAYEAATADLLDANLIDKFHLKAYGIEAVNYNRDIENFDIIKTLLDKIVDKDNFVATYKSPTDMGVNRAKEGIIDDETCQEAGRQEVLRRYFRYRKEFFDGIEPMATLNRMDTLMEKLGIRPEDRKVVAPAREAGKGSEGKGGVGCGAAIELKDGMIVTGKSSRLLHAATSAVLNAVKTTAGIPDDIDIISESVIESVKRMHSEILDAKFGSLNLEEVLVALAISSQTNPTAKKALTMLKELRGCEMHLSKAPSRGDDAGMKKLKVNATYDVVLSQDKNGK